MNRHQLFAQARNLDEDPNFWPDEEWLVYREWINKWLPVWFEHVKGYKATRGEDLVLLLADCPDNFDSFLRDKGI